MTQFSELRDASSKPWTRLSSFTALVFLLLTQSCSGLSQVVGPSQPVLATVGADVVLSCRLEPADDASGMSIEWSREDLDPSYVYVWWDKEEMESSKHPDYKGRTSLVFSQLEFGNISLKLSNVTQADKGKYKCMIRPLGRGCTVELVVGIDPIPVISLAGLGRSSGSVELQCESAGWYPEPPEVLWLDADGNLLSAGPTETVRGPDGFYTVSSRVTVEKKHSNKFTCRVQQNNIKQSREALIQVTDDFFEVQSSNTSSTVGLTASLTAAFILVIIAVFLFVRRRRQTYYGNIMDVETTGASEQTAQQDQLGFSGVRASHTMAEMDSARMKKYKSKINAVGRKYNIEPALIAAIISRQSRAGNVLKDGWGAYSTWGLMQVYVNPDGGGHEARGAWDSEEHLCQGTEILVSFIVQIRNKFPSWTREQQLKGGIAAYMTGDGKVNSYENVDENTACKDFSNDVVARAQWYKKNFF